MHLARTLLVQQRYDDALAELHKLDRTCGHRAMIKALNQEQIQEQCGAETQRHTGNMQDEKYCFDWKMKYRRYGRRRDGGESRKRAAQLHARHRDGGIRALDRDGATDDAQGDYLGSHARRGQLTLKR